VVAQLPTSPDQLPPPKPLAAKPAKSIAFITRQ
jgi:hypothetical protein